MDDKELLELAKQLNDANMPHEAHCSIVPFGKVYNTLVLRGNRAALIRTAATCLEAAAKPAPDDEMGRASVNLTNKPGKPFNEHTERDDSYSLGLIIREDPWKRSPRPTPESKAANDRRLRRNNIGCIATLATVLAIVIGGVIFWFNKVVGWIFD